MSERWIRLICYGVPYSRHEPNEAWGHRVKLQLMPEEARSQKEAPARPTTDPGFRKAFRAGMTMKEPGP